MHIRARGEDGEDVIVHFPRTDAIQELLLLADAIEALPDVMLDDDQPLLIRHSTLQAFLIDVRSMVGFLSGPGPNPRSDDMFARDMSDQWTPDDEAEVADATRTLVQQIHKQLAHITKPRIGDGNKEFPVDVNYTDDELRAIAHQMTEFFNRFAGAPQCQRWATSAHGTTTMELFRLCPTWSGAFPAQAPGDTSALLVSPQPEPCRVLPNSLVKRSRVRTRRRLRLQSVAETEP